ncbi:hypothetical protein EPN96_08940 [bacterium]|nr:MAG: hypothetical protein EPN96_08940 [bacterium]
MSDGAARIIDWREKPVQEEQGRIRPKSARQALGWLGFPVDRSPASAKLPFGPGDVTSGSETELQVAVCGSRAQVDLPLEIENSTYFANLTRRAEAGDMPRQAVRQLERFLSSNPSGIWENSWVRFPLSVLSPRARAEFDKDMLIDRTDASLGFRSDRSRFIFDYHGETWIRIPVSYLLKIALADFAGREKGFSGQEINVAEKLLSNFLSDNTSPETTSFYISGEDGPLALGSETARETALRYLFTQLLLAYANKVFELNNLGQRALAYLSPLPPVRQTELNEHISDAFYRELFMSPCLSGWDRGEEKHNYMGLCHEVLSRSQLNALPKLREAGVIQHNLVVLPNTSNISLANNGTHVSLGSLCLSRSLGDAPDVRALSAEKYLGDLVTKIMEHFLLLFVETYTAAPRRISFADFHPERILGFLPHELDYTHLRMIWRRWKKKAGNSFLGHSMTPYGPKWLDGLLSSVLKLRGDYVPDARLLDYLVCLMSTYENHALDGNTGNWDRLKADLGRMGVFSPKMSMYIPIRQRDLLGCGYSGFEGRHFSVYESFGSDLGPAIDLQRLCLAAAFALAGSGKIEHADIPDTPFVESERRQIFFGAAIGLPTFFVRADTPNLFLRKLVARAVGVRQSRRYPGRLRVGQHEYRLGLVNFLEEEMREVVESLGASELLGDLKARLSGELPGASQRMLSGISGGGRQNPLSKDAESFNKEAEKYYRESLREKQICEAIDLVVPCSGPSGAEREKLAFLAIEAKEGLFREQMSIASITGLLKYILSVVAVRKEREQAIV